MSKIYGESYYNILNKARNENMSNEDKTYQQRVVEELVETSEEILKIYEIDSKSEMASREILLNAPTGSGKTIMCGSYIETMFKNFHNRYVVLWISETPKLVEQSLEKFSDIFKLKTVFYDGTERLDHIGNQVIGVNWEKIKNKRIREDGESNVSIDTYLNTVKEQGIGIITIIDEAHSSTDSDLSQDFLRSYNSDIYIYVTATPKTKKKYTTSISHEEVQNVGFIKEGVEINDLSMIYNDYYQERFNVNNTTQYILNESLRKRDEIEKDLYNFEQEYHNGARPITPLLIIQLPNNSKDIKEHTEKFLESKGYIKDVSYASYMVDDYTDELDRIGRDENIKVLLFKQAISKGWDCPRASVLTLLRDPKDNAFVIQTIGRILRNPYLTRYPSKYDNLNRGYVYIEDTSNTVLSKVVNDIQQENIPVKFSKIREIETKMNQLEKEVICKKDFPLGAVTEQFKNSFKKYVKDEESIFNTSDSSTNINLSERFKIQIHSAQLKSEEIENNGDTEVDLKKRYTKLTEFNTSNEDIEIKLHSECKKYKLNIDYVEKVMIPFLSEYLKITTIRTAEGMLVHMDKIAKVYHTLLDNIKEVYSSDSKVKDSKECIEWELPQFSYILPKDIQIDLEQPEKYPYPECYTKANKLEQRFISFIENSENVRYWYRNGDNGAKYFSLYYDYNNKGHLFYPDFLVETEDTVYILETKGDTTSAINDFKEKSFKDYINYLKLTDIEFNVVTGFVKEIGETFYIYVGDNFQQDKDKSNDTWKPIKF